MAIFHPRNVKFGLRDPGLVVGQDVYHGQKQPKSLFPNFQGGVRVIRVIREDNKESMKFLRFFFAIFSKKEKIIAIFRPRYYYLGRLLQRTSEINLHYIQNIVGPSNDKYVLGTSTLRLLQKSEKQKNLNTLFFLVSQSWQMFA